jgi:hypothetical protein
MSMLENALYPVELNLEEFECGGEELRHDEITWGWVGHAF